MRLVGDRLELRGNGRARRSISVCGAVDDLDGTIRELRGRGVETEQVRVDEYTGKRFTFFADPDGLPLELYEV
jgi:catechol 2,3-dioxygenase-like lactoylglutathione lyase family enzyme